MSRHSYILRSRRRLLGGCLGLGTLAFVLTIVPIRGESLPNIQSSPDGSSSDKAVIADALITATTRVQDLAVSDPNRFAAVLRETLGGQIDRSTENRLVQQAARGGLPLPKRILFVPSPVLGGAAGAYAAENGGILFINAHFRRNQAGLPDLITHEWGHHLNAVLGDGDTREERGQLFLTGIKNAGPLLATFDTALTALENHHATIQFEGRAIPVELWFWDRIADGFKSLGRTIYDHVIKPVVNVAKAVGNTVVTQVKAAAGAVKNAAVGLGNGIKGIGEGIGAGFARMAGQNGVADRLANNARESFGSSGSSFKNAANDAVNLATASGDLFNKTAAELNKVVPHLGTAVNLGASFTPIGPALALSQGAANIKNAYNNGGIKAALEAGGYAALDVGGSVLGRVGKGINAANDAIKAAKAAEGVGKAVGSATKAAEASSKISKLANLIKAAPNEARIGADVVKTLPKGSKYVDYINKANMLVRPKDFIPGRDRDKDGKLIGSGGSNWEKRKNVVAPPPPHVINNRSGSIPPVKQPTHALSQATPNPAPVARPPKNKAAEAAAERAAKNAADQAARELANANKELQKARDLNARIKAEQDARDLAARNKAERDAKDLAAKEKAEQEARDRAARNSDIAARNKELERLNKEQAARDAALKNKAEREAKDRAAQQARAEQAARDLAAKEKAARDLEAKNKAETEARDLAARNKAQRDEADRQAAEEMRRNKKAEDDYRAAQEKERAAEAAKADAASRKAAEDARIAQEKEKAAEAAKAQAAASKAAEDARVAQEKEKAAEDAKAQAAASKAAEAEEMRLNKKAEDEFRAAQEKQKVDEEAKARIAAAKEQELQEARAQKEAAAEQQRQAAAEQAEKQHAEQEAEAGKTPAQAEDEDTTQLTILSPEEAAAQREREGRSGLTEDQEVEAQREAQAELDAARNAEEKAAPTEAESADEEQPKPDDADDEPDEPDDR